MLDLRLGWQSGDANPKSEIQNRNPPHWALDNAENLPKGDKATTYRK